MLLFSSLALFLFLSKVIASLLALMVRRFDDRVEISINKYSME